jgi:F-type H+-transporting ATPase subunit delta
MELSTIAKPYAQAIFEIAEKNESLAEWSELLSTACAIMVDNATQAFISSPSISKSQKIELICALLEKATSRELSKQESAFVNLILNNGRTDALGSISSAFDSAVSNANQSKSFQVVSAFELSEAEEKAIVDDLTSKHKTTVTVDAVVDETLKGGVIIKEGDKVIDTSIKAKVDALSVCLSVN